MKGKVSAVLYERLKAMAEAFIEAEAISDALQNVLPDSVQVIL